MKEKEEENLAAPERAVLPPTPSGTTAQHPPYYRSTRQTPVIERYKSGTTAPPSGTTAQAVLLPIVGS